MYPYLNCLGNRIPLPYKKKSIRRGIMLHHIQTNSIIILLRETCSISQVETSDKNIYTRISSYS